MRRESDTLRVGDAAPEFTLFDANGRAHSLREFLSGGAGTEVPEYAGQPAAYVLLVFDRGTW
jgi:hypothetical protein